MERANCSAICKVSSEKARHLLIILSGLISFIIVAVTVDVPVFSSIKYLSYLFVYILLPGWCLYRVFCINPGSGLKQFCLGFTFGYAQELLVYLLRPFLGQAVVCWGAVIIVMICFPVLYLRMKKKSYEPVNELILPREVFAYVAMAVLVIITVRFYGIAEVPLPESPGGVTYYQDLVWHLSLAAEAKWHNLPFQNPSVAGEALHYYHLPHIHMAMASLIAGIDLSKIVLRFFPLELYFLWAVMLCWAGRALIGGWKAGIIITSLVLSVGSFSGLFVINSARKMGVSYLYIFDLFKNSIFRNPILSPTFLFGVPFFIALIILIKEYWKQERPCVLSHVVIITILFILSAFTKAVILPIFIMALGVMMIWGVVAERKLCKRIFIVLTISVIVYLIARIYTESIYVNFVKLGRYGHDSYVGTKGMIIYYVNKYYPSLLPFTKNILPFFVVFAYAPLTIFGASLLLFYKKCKLNLSELWLLCLCLAPYIVLQNITLVSGGGWNFYIYMSIPLAILSAKGIFLVFSSKTRWGYLFFIKLMIFLLFFSGLSTLFVRMFFPAIGPKYYAERYGDKPLLTNELLSGLRWLRGNTPIDAVIAVNYTQKLWKNKHRWYYTEAAERNKYWYYSAFSERRIFLEGMFNTPQFHYWINIDEKNPAKIPFIEKIKLLDRFFKQKDKNAFIAMRDKFGISYLLNDKRRGINDWLLSFDHSLIELVYSNKDVNIYRVIDRKL